jgi:hypothetical protein
MISMTQLGAAASREVSRPGASQPLGHALLGMNNRLKGDRTMCTRAQPQDDGTARLIRSKDSNRVSQDAGMTTAVSFRGLARS